MTVRRSFQRNDETVAVAAERLAGDHWRVHVGEEVYEFRVASLGDGGVRLVPVGDEARPACVAYGATAGKAFMVRLGGHTHLLQPPEGRRAAGSAGDGSVRAPMTGTVLELCCNEGDLVTEDQVLVVLSAMKMEHKLTAGVAGVVRSVAVAAGDTVDQDAVMVEVEAESDADAAD